MRGSGIIGHAQLISSISATALIVLYLAVHAERVIMTGHINHTK